MTKIINIEYLKKEKYKLVPSPKLIKSSVLSQYEKFSRIPFVLHGKQQQGQNSVFSSNAFFCFNILFAEACFLAFSILPISSKLKLFSFVLFITFFL